MVVGQRVRQGLWRRTLGSIRDEFKIWMFEVIHLDLTYVHRGRMADRGSSFFIFFPWECDEEGGGGRSVGGNRGPLPTHGFAALDSFRIDLLLIYLYTHETSKKTEDGDSR